MSEMKKICILSLFMGWLIMGCSIKEDHPRLKADVNQTIPFNPEKYVCYQAKNSIVVDGVLDDSSWDQAPWSNYFVDIEGGLKPTPEKDTKIKMLWDSDYLYIAAELYDDHIWGNITEHDAVIFYDNDFEIFIDPDGDTHNYMEVEINALNTTWDLVLSKPYRDNGLVIDSWEIPGMKHAVKVYGTINNAYDLDEKWTIELALPWKVLNECAIQTKMPIDGNQWRINFSRVFWPIEINHGNYIKKKNEEGKQLPENNWVWSPQGVIAMHRPETWGYVQFSSDTNASFVMDQDEHIKWALREVYYRQKAYYEENNYFTSDFNALRMEEVQLKEERFYPEIVVNKVGFYATYPSCTKENAIWIIQDDGKIWLKKE